MPKRRPRSHHDRLFKATFQVPVNAQAELELVLPAELFTPEALAVGEAFIPNFRFMLDDVSHVPDKAFVRMVKRSGQAAAVRMLLRDRRDLDALRASLPTIVVYAEDLEEIEAFVVEAFGGKHAEEIHATIEKEAKMARKKFVSIADSWRAEGKAEGEVKGRAEGKAIAVRLVISERFGSIPAAVDAAIAAATSEDLELLLRRAVSAATPLDLIRP